MQERMLRKILKKR